MFKFYAQFKNKWWMPRLLGMLIGFIVMIAGTYIGVWFALGGATPFNIATAIVCFVLAFVGFITMLANIALWLEEL